MRLETQTVRIGEWLGDVPEDWDYEAFFKRFLQNRAGFVCGRDLFKEMAAALKRGATVYATQSGGFEHLVHYCGLYDGWVFWVPRPCYAYKGPIPGAHTDEFYNIIGIRIVEPASSTGDKDCP